MSKAGAIAGIIFTAIFLVCLVLAVLVGAKHQMFWVIVAIAFLLGFIREYTNIKKTTVK